MKRNYIFCVNLCLIACGRGIVNESDLVEKMWVLEGYGAEIGICENNIFPDTIQFEKCGKFKHHFSNEVINNRLECKFIMPIGNTLVGDYRLENDLLNSRTWLYMSEGAVPKQIIELNADTLFFMGYSGIAPPQIYIRLK